MGIRRGEMSHLDCSCRCVSFQFVPEAECYVFIYPGLFKHAKTVEELLELKHHRLQWKDNVLKQPVFLTRGQFCNKHLTNSELIWCCTFRSTWTFSSPGPYTAASLGVNFTKLCISAGFSTQGDTRGLLSYIICRCLLYTSPSPRDRQKSRMPSSA